MMKRIILAVFLMLNFQFVLAHVADDIGNEVSVDQAVQNAIDTCEAGQHCHTSEEIASALRAAGIPAVDTAKAMYNAGIPDAVNVTATAYDMQTDALVIALADTPLHHKHHRFGLGHGGSSGGQATSN